MWIEVVAILCSVWVYSHSNVSLCMHFEKVVRLAGERGSSWFRVRVMRERKRNSRIEWEMAAYFILKKTCELKAGDGKKEGKSLGKFWGWEGTFIFSGHETLVCTQPMWKVPPHSPPSGAVYSTVGMIGRRREEDRIAITV